VSRERRHFQWRRSDLWYSDVVGKKLLGWGTEGRKKGTSDCKTQKSIEGLERRGQKPEQVHVRGG